SFTVHTASETVIRGVIGQPVQLPCFYKVTQSKDISDMCWGRGPCPNSKCNNKILHTTRNRVTFRKSQRYNLQGYISYGDVSLTIVKAKAEDAGTYCCRIEIPGWFNDIKQNIRLEVISAPPVTTTTMRQAPVSPKHFRTTTFAPQATSDHQTTAETSSPAVITVETIAPPTFAVTANDIFPETMMTTSGFPGFPTDFQAVDMRTEDDYVFYSAESIPLPEVTTEFLSTLPAAERTESADTAHMVDDEPTTAPTMVQTPRSTLIPSEIPASSDGNTEKYDDISDKFPSYAILIACLLVVSILLISMLALLFWKRKHTKKFITKSLGPVEDLEKVFSGAEGENNIFSL
ncbi:T-cell immunoglobulin and mucin domain-containing protein 4, partial [Mesitornis unicolor]